MGEIRQGDCHIANGCGNNDLGRGSRRIISYWSEMNCCDINAYCGTYMTTENIVISNICIPVVTHSNHRMTPPDNKLHIHPLRLHVIGVVFQAPIRRFFFLI